MARVNVETQTGDPYIGIIVIPKPYVVCNIRNRNLPPRNGRRKKNNQTDPRYFQFIENDIKLQRERLGVPLQVPDYYKTGTLRIHLKYIADPVIQVVDNRGSDDKLITRNEDRGTEKEDPAMLKSQPAVEESLCGKFLPLATTKCCNDQIERKIEINRKNFPYIDAPASDEKIIIRVNDGYGEQAERPGRLKTYSAIEEALRCNRLRTLKPTRFDVEIQTDNAYIGYLKTPKPYIASCENHQHFPPKSGKKDKSSQTDPSYFKFIENDIQSQKMRLGVPQQVADNFNTGTVRIHLPYIAVPTIMQSTDNLQSDNLIIRIDDGYDLQARKRPRRLETDLVMEEALQSRCSRTRVPTGRPRSDQDKRNEMKPEKLNNNSCNRL